MLDNLPTTDKYVSLAETGYVTKGTYDERRIIEINKEKCLVNLTEKQKKFWGELGKWMGDGKFATDLINKFKQIIIKWKPELQNNNINLHSYIALTRDLKNYMIPPHTDYKYGLITMLFYLPRREELENKNWGTSIYLPKKGEIVNTDQHYSLEKFNKIFTSSYISNTMFGFVKTDNSFHGVEKIGLEDDVQRDLLIYQLTYDINC
jgi:hypothetical protein